MDKEIEKKVKDRWEDFEEVIQNYLDGLKISSKIQVQKEVEQALTFPMEMLRVMSQEECLEYAFVLDRYSFYIQTEINKHKTKLTWAEHNLNISLGKIVKDYGDKWTKFEERKLMAMSDNVFCSSLNKMILASSTTIFSLDQLSYKINVLAKTLKDLGYSKRYQND